jgi:hypothetical protein
VSVNNVKTREDLVGFIQLLRENLGTDPTSWENDTLDDFLEAMDQWCRNQGLTLSANQPWKFFGKALLAAKYYE